VPESDVSSFPAGNAGRLHGVPVPRVGGGLRLPVAPGVPRRRLIGGRWLPAAPAVSVLRVPASVAPILPSACARVLRVGGVRLPGAGGAPRLPANDTARLPAAGAAPRLPSAGGVRLPAALALHIDDGVRFPGGRLLPIAGAFPILRQPCAKSLPIV